MIAFVNTFLSYIVLMLIILAVAALGFSFGLFLRKRKNAKVAAIAVDESEVIPVGLADYSQKTQDNK